MNLALIAGSLAAVLALGGMAWALGLGGGAIGGEEEAMRIAADDLVGFAPEQAFVSEDGHAALVLGGGEAALLKQHGAQVAARRIPSPQVAPISGGVRIASGDRMFGEVVLKLDEDARDKLLTML
jgi:hypothetical protein